MAIPVLNLTLFMKAVARHSHFAVCTVILALVGGVAAPPLWNYMRKEQCAKHFEANAKARLKPGDIQRWATNLLSHTDNGRVKLSSAEIKSTNPLLTLYPGEPSIFIDGSEEVSGRWVQITWAGGLIGSFGFAVGSTNFRTSAGEQWAPGVYILKRR